MSRDESAIDKIYIIEEEVKSIKTYLQLIDNNIKILTNRLSKLSKLLDENKPLEPTEAIAVNHQQITAVIPGNNNAKKSDSLVLGRIKTFGYIVNKAKQPISGVTIKIYDKLGEVIKDKVTDSNGYWDVRLPPGKYGVEYIQEGYRPINKTIILDANMTSLEVK